MNQCERYHECPTIEIWEGLGQVIEEYLSGITLEDVVNKARIKGGNDYASTITWSFFFIKNMMRVSKGMRKIKEFDIVLKSDILITY